MSNISSYPSIYAIGHRCVSNLFSGQVIVEEKVDGSSFSMMKINGELFCRSKSQQIIVENPEKLFSAAVETAKSLDLKEGWIYRCEYLSKPKHNTLAYERIPNKNLILFDVCTGIETYLPYEEKSAEASRIGLEVVPKLFEGVVSSLEQLIPFFEKDSILGGVKIEGFVVKNYNLFTPEKKIAIAKYVSDAFKEKHGVEWKKSNPNKKDVIENLIIQLKTEARWNKAIQHLRDAGQLTQSPKDIGPLLREIQTDVEKEEKEWILEKLWKELWPNIARGIIGGFPEFYKKRLAENCEFKNEEQKV